MHPSTVSSGKALVSTTGGNGVSRTQCSAKYGKRTYFKDEEQRLPPMLYTFPGSGNTWCRLLIEYTTGIFSGAVYNDASLLEALPGEFTCNYAVSVVKVHPHTHGFEELRLGTFNSDNGKCKKGKVNGFRRAILLIRNPFDSIWSEYQRRVSKSHVTGIDRAGFDWHRWQANAASLSHMYHEMWALHHSGIEKHFRPGEPLPFIRSYNTALFSDCVTASAAFDTEDVLYIKYEDLKDRASGANIEAMRKVADFLKTPASVEKLQCAFVLAENRDAHRAVDPARSMTKEDAYTKELTCRMWALFGEFAAKHGYKPYNGHDCSAFNGTAGLGFPKIRNVNVGAQGEYDLKWVKPGAKLIDFGGYDKSLYEPRPGGSGGVGANRRSGGQQMQGNNKQGKRAGGMQKRKEVKQKLIEGAGGGDGGGKV